MLYELLTFDKLPVGGDLQSVLDQATLKAAQEEAPLPAEIRAFLGRLLLGRQPFPTVEAFSTELERVLYDGEYSPTTFNMAFFMHTLFREENDRDATSMKAEQGDNFLAYTAAGESLRSGATRVEHIDGHADEQVSQKNRTVLIGGGLAAVVILGLGYIFFGRPKVDPAIQAQLVEFQRIKAEMEQQKADLDAKARAEAEKTAQLQKQLGETKSAEEKAKIQKQLEENQQRKQDLERQQKAAEQRLADQRQAEQKLAEQKRATETKVAAAPPVPEAPKPQPMQDALRQAAVLICQKAGGEITILYQDKPLEYTLYQRQPKQAVEVTSKTIDHELDHPEKAHKPAANHPWRRSFKPAPVPSPQGQP